MSNDPAGKITINKCKQLLNVAYKLQDEGVDNESIMKMAIFISIVFAENADIQPDKFTDILKDTWMKIYKVIDDVHENTIWVSSKPITDEEQ